MYSLPAEYWDEDSLKDIGNGLGEFIKSAKEMKLRRYTSYACICIFMWLDRPLPGSVSLFHDDYEWVQPLDYEHVPFRCRRCHALGHLFRDYPLNAKAQNSDPSDKPDQDGFIKVANCKISHKKTSTGKKPQQGTASIPSTSNSFEVLAKTSDDHTLHTSPSPKSSSSSAILHLAGSPSIT